MSRRTLLRGAVAAATAGAAGCGRAGQATQVAVVWSGSELELFDRVLDSYRRERGQPVDVISAGDDIDQFLRTRREAETHPDVAILPRLGLINDFADRGWLSPLDQTEIGGRFPDPWTELLTFKGELYGAWVKAAHKSVLWARPSTFSTGPPPKTFADLTDLVRGLAARRPPAPLAIGAADGWVLSDWFENVLAEETSPEEYKALALAGADWRAPAVRTTLERLAALWSIPGALPDGGARALLTQYEEAVIQVVRTKRAAMMFGADFAYGPVRDFQRPDDEPVQPYRFPNVSGDRGWLVVNGDAAVVLRDNKAAHDLVDWLTGEQAWPAFEPWLRSGGYLTPNHTIPPDAFQHIVTRQLVGQFLSARDLRYDLSDRLTGPLAPGDGRGFWKILQDFFADATASTPDIARAVGRAVDRFADAGGGT